MGYEFFEKQATVIIYVTGKGCDRMNREELDYFEKQQSRKYNVPIKYLCYDASYDERDKWDVMRIGALRYLGLEGSMKRNKFVDFLLQFIRYVAGEHDRVLVIGNCFGGLLVSKVADIIMSDSKRKSNRVPVPENVRFITFASLYTSPSPMCLHYVLRGDWSLKFNGAEKLPRNDNVIFMSLPDQAIRKLSSLRIHNSYDELIDISFKTKLPPTPTDFRYCYGRPKILHVTTTYPNMRTNVSCDDIRIVGKNSAKPGPKRSTRRKLFTARQTDSSVGR